MRGFCTWDGQIRNAGTSQGQERAQRTATPGARGPSRASRRLCAALRDVGDCVVGMRDGGVRQPLEAGTGGPRPTVSCAHRSICIEDALHDSSILDQGNDKHRTQALGALQWIGFVDPADGPRPRSCCHGRSQCAMKDYLHHAQRAAALVMGRNALQLAALEQQSAIQEQFDVFWKQMTKVARLVRVIHEKACVGLLDRAGKALPRSPAMKCRGHKN